MYTTIINAEELAGMIGQENLSIIDCRFSLADTDAGKKSYLKSHIPDAHYAHLDDDLSGKIIKGKTGRHPLPDIKTFAKKCGQWGIDKNTQAVVYDDNHGGIAARLWFLLKWLGHENVAVLNGGWKYWSENGFPISEELPAASEKIFLPKENGSLIAPLEKVEKIQKDQHFQLIDSRTADRYRGENETIDPVAGHIPGAISMSFLDNIGPDGLFLQKEALGKRFEKLLAQKSTEHCVFYCGSGVTACHNLLALEHIGVKGAKLYPGSWSEWIVDEKREVATGDH